ncbi:uncharacterized protein [Miscanthus floridulus]|uniref:uncharacterized protein isoform X2 n=1 Tax=Miscanthus floridulus TaxID=154761 RepID=UPI00345A96BE
MRILGKHQGIVPPRLTVAAGNSSASTGLNNSVLLKLRDRCNLREDRHKFVELICIHLYCVIAICSLLQLLDYGMRDESELHQ